MKNRLIVMAAAIVLACSPVAAQAKEILNLWSPDSKNPDPASFTRTASTGGSFIVANTDLQPTGTGVFNPFLTIQENGQERAFNWDMGNSQQTAVLDEKSGGSARTVDLLLSALKTVNIGGLDYYQFTLDVNQVSDGPISLNQIQIFQSQSALQPSRDSNGNPVGFSIQEAAADSNTAQFHDALLGLPLGSTEVFRMNSGANAADLASISGYEIQSPTQHGSGSGDMIFYVLASTFNPALGNHITLFTQFGTPDGQLSSNDGFEEWSALQGENDDNGTFSTPVPPTAVMLLSGLASLGLARAGLRLRRKKEAAV